MNLNSIDSSKGWTYYLSMIHTSSDPLDFLIGTDNIPYKKFNRLMTSAKNKRGHHKQTEQVCIANT